VDYEERLHAPVRWWALGGLVVVAAWLACAVAIPPLAAAVTAVVVAVLVGAFLLGYGSPRIQVGDGVLRAGRARIGVELLGTATPLDAASTRRQAGVDADARAFLLLRPYLPRAVRVDLCDPADPAPYWLISSRRPERLARAVSAATGRLTAEHVTGED